MNETIKQLQSIQKLDVTIHDLRSRLEEIPRRKEDIDKQISEKTVEIETLRTNMDNLQKEKDDQEKLLFIEQEKLKKQKARLSGVNIRNPGAYYANQREVEKLKKDIDVMEATLLESMQALEETRNKLEQLEGEKEELEASHSEVSQKVDTRVKAISAELEDELKRREELAENVEPKALALYEKIQGRFPGGAICRAVKEMCTGCYMQIPPQLFNELQRQDALITCPTCQRILYYVPDEEQTAEASGP